MLEQIIGAALQGMLGGSAQRPAGGPGGGIGGGLGDMLGSALGGGGSRGGAAAGGLGGGLAALILQMLSQPGGLQSILKQFEQAGLGQQAQSWVSTGPNLPVSPEDLMKVFGQGQLAQWAQQMGVSHEQAAGGLSAALPEVVNHMTPQGALPEGNDLEDLVASMRRSLGR